MNDIVTLPTSALTDHASPKTSSRFKHISTRDVHDILVNEGFQLAEVKVPRRTVRRDPLYSAHQLDFRHPDFKALPDGSVPRILFKNAHDGSASARFTMGVFRFICSNGLVVGSTYANEVVRHAGETAATLIERVRKLSKNTAPLFAQIDSWTRKELSAPEASEFARLAAVLRFGDAQRFDPDQLLHVRRPQDDGRTLWAVFNRVQEATSAGGIIGFSADGRQLRSRPLTSIDQSLSFNADLWRLAEEFA